MKPIFGLLTIRQFIAVIALVIVIAAALITKFSIFSPGELSAHGQIDSTAVISDAIKKGTIDPVKSLKVNSHADLKGQCSACHAPPWSSKNMAQRCLECHVEISTELQNPHALHYVATADSVSCTSQCHTEHQGTSGSITQVKSDHFQNVNLAFSLNSHQTNSNGMPFSCVDCHPKSLNEFSSETCLKCHSEIDATLAQTHSQTFGNDCLKCHDGLESYGKDFNHNLVSFKLTGSHALSSTACVDCHKDSRTINDLKLAPQDCASCHQKDDKHSGAFGAACAQCHNENDWKQINFNHQQTGYPLTGKHQTTDCLSCHVDNVLTGLPQDCASCHEKDDKHEGAFGVSCDKCHNESDWKEINFDHQQTNYPLNGKHQTADCLSCHVDNVLKGLPQDCASCHQKDDNHSGQLANCASCHTSTDWNQINFDHKTTGYPLSGKHTSVDCFSCHVNDVYKGTATNCIDCHQKDDNHQAALGKDCARCHTPGGWNEIDFQHSTTAFKLTGSHSTAACSSCHSNGVFKGTPTDCYSCHSSKDPHQGKYGQSCASCHDTSSWKGALFDHDKISLLQSCNNCHPGMDPHNGANGPYCSSCHSAAGGGFSGGGHSAAFPLTGAHSSVACASCHIGGTYLGTPKDCYSCHKSNDKHNGANGTKCASCHNTSGWTQTAVDHSTTAFPLTGKHTTVACASCHVNGVYKGTSYCLLFVPLGQITTQRNSGYQLRQLPYHCWLAHHDYQPY